MILAFIAIAFFCFGLGLLTAVLCLSAKDGDSIQEFQQTMRAAKRCTR